MKLFLDSGNSRIKWGVHDGQNWQADGALAPEAIPELADIARRYRLGGAWLANVAGPARAAAIADVLAGCGQDLQIATSSGAAAGVRNGYDFPEKLGVDRWCALITARAAWPGECLVVMAGTATTLDRLSAEGEFLGGMILPGLDLMHRSLARDTADLPLARGTPRPWPRCTEDAITSGCLEAQIGAIERTFARLADPARAICLIGGGAADCLRPQLGIPNRPMPRLVLEGLRRLAGG